MTAKRPNSPFTCLGFGGITSTKGIHLQMGSEVYLLPCDGSRWDEYTDADTAKREQILADLLLESKLDALVEDVPVAAPSTVSKPDEDTRVIVKKAGRKPGPMKTGEAATIGDA